MIGYRAIIPALAAVGLAVSVYLTVVHFGQGQVPLLCGTSGAINCEQVTTSPESLIGPLPVAVLGVIWFLGMLALAFAGGPKNPRIGTPTHRLIWSVIGLIAILYLVYAELFLIGAICLWCSVVHLVVFALFLVSVNEFVEGAG